MDIQFKVDLGPLEAALREVPKLRMARVHAPGAAPFQSPSQTPWPRAMIPPRASKHASSARAGRLPATPRRGCARTAPTHSSITRRASRVGSKPGSATQISCRALSPSARSIRSRVANEALR